MGKLIGGFIAGVAVVAVLVWAMAGSLMFREVPSPFGVEETVARIQQNIQAAGNGWDLVGLRNPGKAIEQDGGNTLPVLMVEACSTRYSGPILKNDAIRFLSILMPCKISVYKKSDGKVYIGLMNARLIGSLFGAEVSALMSQVAADQARFVTFDPTKPAPPMIKGTPGGAATGASGAAAGGC
ncbi:MAG: DUF302 domain-containing protein [Rhodocyclaceae bacterium]|nr:DUF302 domain-containing protein [Rhodocyclaceae bacterium]